MREQDWVNRAVFILAGTVDLCYGGGNPYDDRAARDIEKEIRRWERKRPDAFRPLYFLAADADAGRPFPTVCYTSAGHGM